MADSLRDELDAYKRRTQISPLQSGESGPAYRQRLADEDAEVRDEIQKQKEAAQREADAAERQRRSDLRKNEAHLSNEIKERTTTIEEAPKKRAKLEGELAGIEGEWQADEKTAAKKQWFGLGGPTESALEAQTRLDTHKSAWNTKKAEIDALDTEASTAAKDRETLQKKYTPYQSAVSSLDEQEFSEREARLIGAPTVPSPAASAPPATATTPPQGQPQSATGTQNVSPGSSHGTSRQPAARQPDPIPATVPGSAAANFWKGTAIPKTFDQSAWDDADRAAFKALPALEKKKFTQAAIQDRLQNEILTKRRQIIDRKGDVARFDKDQAGMSKDRKAIIEAAQGEKPLDFLGALAEELAGRGKTAAAAAGQAYASVGTGLLDLTTAAQAALGADPEDTWTKDFADGVRQFYSEGQDEKYRDAVATKLASGLASAHSFMAPGGIVGRVLGGGSRGITAASAITGAVINGGSAYSEALEMGMDQPQAFTRMAVGMGLGTTEAVGVGGILAKLDKLSRGGLGKFFRNLATQGAEEGLQEAFQTAGTDIADLFILGKDDPRAKSFEKIRADATEAGLWGAVTGVLFTGLVDGAQRRDFRRQAETIDADIATLRTTASQIDPAEGYAGAAQTITEREIAGYKGDLEADMAGFDVEAGQFPVAPTEPLAVLVAKRDTLAAVDRTGMDTARVEAIDAAQAQLDTLIAARSTTPEQIAIAAELTIGQQGNLARAESAIQQAEAELAIESEETFRNPADWHARMATRQKLRAALSDKIIAARGEATTDEGRALLSVLPIAKEVSQYPDVQADPNQNGKVNGSSQRQIAMAVAKVANGQPLSEAELNLRSGNVSSPGAIFQRDKATGRITIKNPETLAALEKNSPLLAQAYKDYEIRSLQAPPDTQETPAGTPNETPASQRAATDRRGVQPNGPQAGGQPGSRVTYQIPVSRRGGESRVVTFTAANDADAREMLADGRAFESAPLQPGETFDLGQMQQGANAELSTPPAPDVPETNFGNIKGPKPSTAEAKYLPILRPLAPFFRQIVFTNEELNSGGFVFSKGNLVVSIPDADRQLRTTSQARRVAVEEVIHSILVQAEEAGDINTSQIFDALPESLKKSLRSSYKAAASRQNAAWQLGHEFLRMVIQRKVRFSEDGTVTWTDAGGQLISEQSNPALLARLREALSALLEYLGNLPARLRQDGVPDATINAIGQAERIVRETLSQVAKAQAAMPELNTPADLAGEKIDQEWTAFAPDTRSLGIPRAEMPQIKAEARGALTQFLKARGVTHEQEDVLPGILHPTQAEYSQAKVDKARKFTGGDRAILVSADDHVVDGHHQWMAKLTDEPNEPMRVIRLNAPIRDLLPLVAEFPSTEQSNESTQPQQNPPAASSQTPPPQQPRSENVPQPGSTNPPIGEETLDSLPPLTEDEQIDLARNLSPREWEAANLPADELRDFLAGAHLDQRAGVPRMTDRSLSRLLDYFDRTDAQDKADIIRDELERRAFEEDATTNEAAANEGMYELLEAVRMLGGIPTTDPALQGEIDIMRETPAAREVGLFRRNAGALDLLRSNLADYGFDFATPADLVEALQERLTTGTPIYGTAANALFSQASDAEYLAAVEAGDMEAAQRMVDEAAKAAGYTTGPVWHGTPDGRFLDTDPVFRSEFERYGGFGGSKDNVQWFAMSKAVADTYADDRRAFDYQNSVPKTIRTFLRFSNPLIVDGEFKPWRDAQRRGKTSNVIEQAIKDGNDGVIIRNVKDNYNTMPGDRSPATTTYATFSASQIKSADPVTRDANGNVIPLSQRFNPESDNILFSQATPDTRRLQASNALVIGPALFSQRAFHGTPHKIDGAFSLDKIGTGEGAQVYGWGLYFAENPEVAEVYRKSLSTEIVVDGKVILRNNKRVESTGIASVDDLLIANDGDLQAALKQAREYDKEGSRGGWGEAVSYLEKANVAAETRGNTYTVELDVDANDLLDWDKPLSEQSEKFQKSFGYMRKKLTARIEERRKDDSRDMESRGLRATEYEALETKSGAGWYGNLAEFLGSEQKASDYLRDIGVPGIRYLDGDSRNAGGWHITPPSETVSGKWMVKSRDYNSKGLHFDTEKEAREALAEKIAGQTYNYVIFDDTKIRILEENGQPVSFSEASTLENPSEALFSQSATLDERAIGAGQLLLQLRETPPQPAPAPQQSTARPQQLTPEMRRLVEENLGLAGWAAGRYSNIEGLGEAREDILQEARLGLVDAARSYKPAMGTFGNWAGRIMINRLNKKYRKALNTTTREGISADAPLTPDGEDSLADVTPAPAQRRGPDEDGLTVLRNLMATLPAREQSILAGLAQGKDTRTIGSEVGLSHEGVRKASRKAAQWLREKLLEKNITSSTDIFPAEGMLASQADESAITEQVGSFWLDIARNEDAFSLGPNSKATDMRTILDDMDGRAIKIIEHKTHDGRIYEYEFLDPKGGNIRLDLGSDFPFVDSSRSKTLATRIYQAIYTWAHNNGKIIHEDAGGLSRIAWLRRTSQMLSSALRFRTTQHMRPSKEQEFTDWNESDTPEATRYNIGLLARKEAELTFDRLPELGGYRYSDGTFYDNRGIRIPTHLRDKVFRSRITAIDPGFDEGAGPRTLARSLATVQQEEAIRSGDALLRPDPARSEQGFDPRNDQSGLTSVLYSQPSSNLDHAALDRLEAEAISEASGGRPIGDPRLAFSMDNEIWRAMDEWRKSQFQSQREAEWQAAAEIMLRRDPRLVEDSLIEKGMAREILNPVETKAAQKLIAWLSTQPRTDENRQKIQTLIFAYRETGSAAGRAMTARRDPHKTPAQRWQEYFARKIYTPPPRVQRDIEQAPSRRALMARIATLETRLRSAIAQANAHERASIEQELAAARQTATKEAILQSDYAERIKPLEEKLAKMGVSIDDILGGQVELRLMGAQIIKDVAADLDEKKRAVIRHIQSTKGATAPEKISQRFSMPLREVRALYNDYREKLKAELMRRFESGINLDELETAGAERALLSQTTAERTRRSPEEAAAMAEKALRMMAFFKYEDLGRIKTRRQSAPVAQNQDGPPWDRPQGPGQTLPDQRLDLRQVWEGQPQGDARYMPPSDRGRLFTDQPATMPTGEGRTTETGRLDLGDRPFDMTGEGRTGDRQLFQEFETPWAGDVAYRIDPESEVDMLHLSRTIDTLKGGTWVDYATEFAIANLLSAPITAITNLTGYGYGAYELTFKRAIEAAINRGKVPTGAQTGEFRHMMRALAPGLARAAANARIAWATESPIFARDVLNTQTEMELNTQDERTIRAYIPGAFGRVVRIPFRSLLAADEFMKTFMGQANAAGYAYRLAKARGFTGPQIERFVAAQLAQKGSAAWEWSVREADRLSFQTPLRDWHAMKETGEGNFIEAGLRWLQDVKNADTADMNAAQKLGSLALRAFFPFIRTPYRLVETGLQNTLPGSLLDAVFSARDRKIKDADGNVVATIKADDAKKSATRATIINAALWTALLSAIGEGDEDDDDKPILITGSRPYEDRSTSTGVRQLAYRTTPPYSVRIGDMVWSYQRIDPFSTMLATTVDAIREIKETTRGKPGREASSSIIAGIYSQLLDKASLRGFAELNDLLAGTTSPMEYGVQQFAAWTVPNAIRNPIRNSDTVFRDTRSEPLSPEAIAYQFLPLPSLAPPAKRDAYGREVERPGNWLTRTFVPGMPGQSNEPHPIDLFAARYNLRHPSTKWAPATPPNRMQRGGEQKEMTAEEYNRFLALRGRIFTALARETGLLGKRQPTDEDREKITQAGSKATREAKRILFGAE